jgi:ankyrin repeat protein
MEAAGCGHVEVLRLLLAGGAAVDAVGTAATAYGWTAFHFACDTNQAECALALAMAGCDIEIKSLPARAGSRDSGSKTGRE